VTLYCATSNPGKLAEFQAAAPRGLRIIAAPPFDCPETGASFEENAVEKALRAAEDVRGPVFADDSGLVVDAIGGEPGVHSARYAGPAATDAQNRARLLRRLRARKRPAARFVCLLALARRGRLLLTCRGVCEGLILDAPRGSGGFGYDPLFFFPPLGRTFAELTVEEKSAHSHRGQAFRLLVEELPRLLNYTRRFHEPR